MKSSRRKAEFTERVIKAAKLAPMLFPKHLRHLAQSRDEIAFSARDSRLKTASLFSSGNNNLKLKSIHLLVELSSEELTRLEEWHQTNNRGWIEESHRNAIYTRQLLARARENFIGKIGINSSTQFGCIDVINVYTETFSSCLLSLVHLPTGSVLLNFVIFCTDKAISRIQNVDISELSPVVQFKGYNIFRRESAITYHYSRQNLATELVQGELGALEQESLKILRAALGKMKINMDEDRPVFKGFDLINDSKSLVFPADATKEARQEECEFVHKSHHYPRYPELENSNVYLDLNEFKHESYDLLVVRSHAFDSFKGEFELNNFRCGENEIFDSAMVFSLITILTHKITFQMKLLEAEAGYGQRSSSDSEKQRVVFNILEALSLIKDEANSLIESANRICQEKYRPLFSRRLDYLVKGLEQLVARTEREYKFTSDKLNMGVIRSNGRYSFILSCFAVVQIALAYLAIDWQKQPNVGVQIGQIKNFFAEKAAALYQLIQFLVS
ncbi:hypothetical protein [Pseudomonas sp. B21-047]|uniref:hypothetical protein n=1 Tax=Pseudomonas sp. B21-047 TaxID=2895489 RepID=UPI00215DF00A|nr:hypothetical protein [Pseudomonas sp. B21-047]UVL04758.1 hypothetical protein LOY26_04205 [Pseudomonas sp. B21-047]